MRNRKEPKKPDTAQLLPDGSTSLTGRDPIAIVGIGCRYPGASNPEELWRLLMEGRETVGPYPGGRFEELDALYADARRKPGRILTDRGGFLPDVADFDAQCFEISPREAVYIDPQHRLLLEVAWEALEDAGQVREDYEGSATGVYMGLWASEYEARLYESASELDFYSVTGCGRASASGRISFMFGFEGPSVTVDTACSTSLVAAHTACRALWSGEIDMALAGGANLILGTEISELFTQAKMLSPDGRCKFGDASANGFVRSEGAGIVVLKRLSRAIADRDSIYALVRGGAVNNDGRSSGLLVTPSRAGQREMLHAAWKSAGVNPGDIRYIEMHGTGTSVGDPVEIEAAGTALAEAGATQPCALGSAKTNIGHTETAAGVLGLIKAALVLQHRRVPPSLHFRTPNPKIGWEKIPVRVAAEGLDLSQEPGLLLGGVNSFGMTGTNAHLVLQEARRRPDRNSQGTGPYLLPVSARSPEALQALLRAHHAAIQDGTIQDGGLGLDAPIRDICYTASVRRNHHEFRAAIVGETLEGLEGNLAAAIANEDCEEVIFNRVTAGIDKIVFVAPGQGSQWVGMARELSEREPVFRQAFEQCDAAILREAGWSLMDRVLGPDAQRYLSEIDTIQPALFSMSVSLAAVWRSWGVEPDAVVGHSMGEAAAAHIAGILSLEDAVAVICRRSRLMTTIRGAGSMATVQLPLAEVESLVTTRPDISIGASNGPETTVVSGDTKAVEALLKELEAKEIYCRLVKVDVASHSAQVDPILEPLRTQLAHIRPQAATVPMLSTVAGEFAADGGGAGTVMDSAYWAENLRRAVRFAPAIERLAAEGHSVFVELSPHPILLPSIVASARAANPDTLAIPSLRREKPERRTLLCGLAALYAAGRDIDWDRLYPAEARSVRLPQYPFQRERCWPEPAGPSQTRSARRSVGQNPLLARRLESSLAPTAVLWESDLSLTNPSYLGDHRVLQSTVFPAAGYIAMARSAARERFPEENFEVRDVSFESTAYIPEQGSKTFQLALLPDGENAFRFEVRSRGDEGEAGWPLRSKGRIERVTAYEPGTAGEEAGIAAGISIADLVRRAVLHHGGEDHYRFMRESGLQYGPAFQLIQEAWAGEGESLCRFRMRQGEAERPEFNPPLLDACFQAMFHVHPDEEAFRHGGTYLPVSADRIRFFEEALPENGDLFIQAKLLGCDARKGTFRGDLRLLSREGRVALEILGMEVRRVAEEGSSADESLYVLEWVQYPAQDRVAPRTQAEKMDRENWLVFADRGGFAEELKKTVETAGGRCVLVRPASEFKVLGDREFQVNPASRDELDRLFEEMERSGSKFTAVLHLTSLDLSPEEERDAATLIRAQAAGCQQVPLIVQAIAKRSWSDPPRLWLTTAGAVAVAGDADASAIESAAMWGIGAMAAREHGELRPSLVDVGAAPGTREVIALMQEVCRGDGEDRIAFRAGKRYVARLAQFSPRAAEPEAPLLASGEEYRIELPSAGILDHLELRAFRVPDLTSDEVAIEVAAAGLNFIDVTKVMGIYPGADPSDPIRLGIECAGTVAAVGSRVERIQPGDAVLALNGWTRATAMTASRTTAPAELVFPKPAALTFEQAATTPIAYLTAYYSLVELARVRKGDWVLIHSGTGGVGLAAIEIAKWAGAKIIATAGSEEKRDYLRSLGIEHVLPSRSSSFAAGVLETTNGRGVDVVLNSLTGELQGKSLEVLAPYGRFVELGKKDIYDDRQVGLKIFRENISFYAVDLAAALEDRRPYLAGLMRHVLRHIESGEWRPLPVTAFSSSDPADPFRFMAQAKHIGKIAICMDREVRVLPELGLPLFSRDASYVITGGLGGVGLTVAEWMARNGAGHLALLSRRQPSNEALEAMERMRECGAAVTPLQADVGREGDLRRALAEVRASGWPIRGVLHAAAAIDDALVMDLTPERFLPALDSKIAGAWNLDRTTLEDVLDFFVLFSSIGAIHPQPGMGSYAAANAFVDAFAHYRRARGRPAISVNWCVWDRIGLAKEAGTLRSSETWNEEGIRNFSGREALEALGRILATDPVQAIVLSFNAEKFVESRGAGNVPPLFSSLIAKNGGARSGRSEILDRLNVAETSPARHELLESWLVETLGKVLKLAIAKIDRERPLGSMGLDSLMGLELVRRLGQSLGVAVPATVVFNYPTVRSLAKHLLGRLQLASIEPDVPATQPVALSLSQRDGSNGSNDLDTDRSLAELSGELSEEEALAVLIGEASPHGRSSE